MPSVSPQVLAIEGVYAEIQALISAGTLTGAFGGVTLTTADVYKLRVVTSRKPPLTRYPAIVCGMALDEGESLDGGTNASEWIGYPVLVGLFAPANEVFNLDADADVFLRWRDILFRHFHNKAPTQVAASLTTLTQTKVEPRQIVDGGHWEDVNLFASALLIRCVCDQLRV